VGSGATVVNSLFIHTSILWEWKLGHTLLLPCMMA
jgi:hypothetical protein